MKPLKPSAREKKRYLKVSGAVKDIEKSILSGIGVLGMSKVGLGWVKSGKGNTIISVNRGAVNDVRACFALWPETIQVMKVSGTLKGLGK